MTEATIKVKGLSELNRFLQELPAKLQRNVMSGALRAGAKPIRDAARHNIHSVSGKLAKGIKIKSKLKGTQVLARIVVTGEHAFLGHMLEYTGAAPHVIRAHGGALLTGGRFVSEVQHPGFQPRPFLRPALDSKAAEATVKAAEYIKYRLATKNGIDTSGVQIEVEE